MSTRGPTWDDLVALGAGGLVATMRRYLDQLTVSLAAESVRSYATTMRQFTAFLIDFDPSLTRVADIDRYHLEAYKQHLLQRPVGDGAVVSKLTRRQRLRTVRVFFERIIEWGYDDAPARNPVFHGDIPRRDEPLPRFLDDPTAAKFMRALADEPDPCRRLVVEILARTGMRVGELCALEDDAVVQIGDAHWLRVPVGKLHNDRYVPLHPLIVTADELIQAVVSAHVLEDVVLPPARESQTGQSGRADLVGAEVGDDRGLMAVLGAHHHPPPGAAAADGDVVFGDREHIRRVLDAGLADPNASFAGSGKFVARLATWHPFPENYPASRGV